MNILRSLFFDDFDKILEASKEEEIFNGIVFLKILKSMSDRTVIVVAPILKQTIDQSLSQKHIMDTPNDIRDNWYLIQRIIKPTGFNLDPIINKVLQHGRSVEIHIFIYEFFNTYRKLKDQNGAFARSQRRKQLEIHNGIVNIDQCVHLFEKLVFLLSKACKTRLLEVF